MRKQHKQSGTGRGRSQQHGDSGSGAASKLSVSALISEPNIWSDWQPALEISPLSWARVAGLLMREVEPEAVINALAPPLAAMRETLELEIADCVDEDPSKVSVTFEGFYDAFEDETPKALRAFLNGLETNCDFDWLRSSIANHIGFEASLMWFVLNGLAYASCYSAFDMSKINGDARWLAELEFFEPARMGADVFVARHFYKGVIKRFPFAKSPPFEDGVQPYREDPLHNGDDWLTRRRRLDRRFTQDMDRVHKAGGDTQALPTDIWIQDRTHNHWARAIETARVPAFDWRRQAAFMLRSVPLEIAAGAVERAIIDMAATTARATLSFAQERGIPSNEITYGQWFVWWREHWQHWDNPLFGSLRELCLEPDAAMVGDWLTRIDPIVFANFLVECAHGFVINEELGRGGSTAPRITSQLFHFDKFRPFKTMNLIGLTLKLWQRFCDDHAIISDHSELYCDFGVEWNLPMIAQQPRWPQ
ncbi:MAG: hypothetical protein AAF127_00185 [Pseudomonadota bacterium]